MGARLGVMILAAGRGSRLGGRPKCLVRVDGQTLLHRTLEQVAALQPAATVLVLGHHADTIEAELGATARATLRTVRNPNPGDEPADSLRLGLDALPPGLDAVMVLLSDLPLLDAQDLQAAWQAFSTRPPGCQVLQPRLDGQPAHPVVFDAALRAELLTQAGGLRAWRAAHPAAVHDWPVPDPSHHQDLDTPADLERLRTLTGRHWDLPPLLA